MGAWTDSLERVYARREHLFDAALHDLARALSADNDGDTPAVVLHYSQLAAARIVAWRKSLPDQGEPEPDMADGNTDRDMLRRAALMILFADEGEESVPKALRMAEAGLRTLWKRHRAAP